VIALPLYLTFVATTAALIAIPGPNVALIVANSVAYGTRFGLLTVAGTSTAVVLHLSLTVLGMAGLLAVLADWFEWIRWAGVAYLLWIGIAQWNAPPADLTHTRAQPRSVREIYGRGLVVGLTNPKTLLFYGAFFPQFISASAAPEGQIAVLSLTFLAVAILLDGGWALLAARARGFLATRGRLRNRLSGGLLIAAGLGLALARRR
jgi:threonine/homoserine/homoserine lactone efflux protein